MRRPDGFVWGPMACAIFLSAGLAGVLFAEDVPTSSSRKPATSSASSRAPVAPVSLKSLENKMDEILNRQSQILKRLDEVMAELQIVKVRATIR